MCHWSRDGCNNEVGTITDIAEVAAVVNRAAPDAILHTDAFSGVLARLDRSRPTSI